MPYVQRGADGKITGIFKAARPGIAEELVSDKDPELVAFRKLVGFTFTPSTVEEFERWSTKNRPAHQVVAGEMKQIHASIIGHLASFAWLEATLSRLLYDILGAAGGHIAYAIFYTPSGFDGRLQIVSNALAQLLEDKCQRASPHIRAHAKFMRIAWAAIIEEMGQAKKTRNIIAHGTPMTVSVRGKQHARLTAPPFHHSEVGRPISKGTIPGMSAAQLAGAVDNLSPVTHCICAMSEAVIAFHDGKPDTLKETASRLAGRLKAIRNLRQDG